MNPKHNNVYKMEKIMRHNQTIKSGCKDWSLKMLRDQQLQKNITAKIKLGQAEHLLLSSAVLANILSIFILFSWNWHWNFPYWMWNEFMLQFQ